MGGESGSDPPKQLPDLSLPQLEEALWKSVQGGNLKNLKQFISDRSKHPKFKDILNCENEEYEIDGGNVVLHCVRQGRDKGSSSNKDYLGCIDLLVEHGANIDSLDKFKRTSLAYAVNNKYVNYVPRLLKLGASTQVKDQDGITPFHAAIINGYKDIIIKFLEHDPQLIHLRDEKGAPPLVIAVKYGRVDVCNLLLERGADVKAAEQKTNRTPVYHAIRNKNMEIFDLLLKHKPDLDTVDSEGRSILYLCCGSPDVRYFNKVLALCPKFSKKIMDQKADDDKTSIIVACQNGNAEQLKYLLEGGASLTTKDVDGRTGLHHCADNLETQCAEMLLEKDQSILEVKDTQGYTPLALAVLVGNMNFIRLLLDKGADIDTKDNEGHKLSHWAAVSGHLKVLDVLLQHKADFSSHDNHHAYPIHYAAQMNGANAGHSDSKISEKVLRKVIDSKVKLDVLDDAGRQPLLWAACSGNAESCKLLLKAGADINSRDKDDLTALHCAASRGHFECVEVLRKNGADCNLMDKNKCTPLFYAITLGNTSCTKALLAAKADVNHIDDRGRNPAHCAAIKGCIDTIKMLEKEKADLWQQNNKGDYPIHEAAQKGHLDVVKYLIRQKNDRSVVNLTNRAGKTLLHIAAATNNLPLCKLLLNHDCNKNATMKHSGKEFTAYDLAVIKGYKEAADYLKSKGAQPYADLSNTEKRDSKSAQRRNKQTVETVQEDVVLTPVTGEKKPSTQKGAGKGGSPAKGSKSPEKKGPAGATGKKVAVGAAAAGVAGKTTDKTDSANDKKETANGEAKTKTENENALGKDVKDSPEHKKTQSPAKGKGSPAKSESPKHDKSVGIDKSETAVNTEKVEDSGKKDSDKTAGKTDTGGKNDKLKKKPSADSVLDKEDGIRTSNVSLRSEESPSPSSKNASTQKSKPSELSRGTSPGLRMGGSQGKQKEAGKFVSLEKSEVQKEEEEDNSPEKSKSRRGHRVGFNKSDNEDSGNETDHSRRRHRKNKKPYLDHVYRSVRSYQNTRNHSRNLNQLKRAQIHTGPMHDIVMFSKMMDNYRRGLAGEAEEMDIRQYANWDGYLTDQLRFVSHLYTDENKSPRDIQDAAKEQHMMLATEANNRKKDTDVRCTLIMENEEVQRRKNTDMDREIDNLASRTAEMFDNVKSGASSSLASAKTRNLQLRDEMRKSREERIRMTEDPHEREMLRRQQLEDEFMDQQSEMDQSRKERFKKWHRRKDEEMRRRLLQAYRPYFPNDVFQPKQVCVSGGRVKSAGRHRIDQTSASPSSRRSFQSPRPSSHRSDSNYSVAQYKLKEDKTQVQMTPYGLRRVRNQERPTYEDVEDELADAIFFSPSRCTKSADMTANWSRKYDGSIRPRTGLVFVEPRVYDDLMREEKQAKQRISTEVRHPLMNGDSRMHSEFGDSVLS